MLNITRGRGADQEFPEKETDEWGREEMEIMVALLVDVLVVTVRKELSYQHCGTGFFSDQL